MNTLYYSSLGMASIDKGNANGKLIDFEIDFEKDHKAGEKVMRRIVDYIELNLDRNQDNILLYANSWSVFFRREELPAWIEKALYPNGWKPEKRNNKKKGS